MFLEGVIVLLAATAVYLLVLNRRADALPANAAREEKWLKDEELDVSKE